MPVLKEQQSAEKKSTKNWKRIVVKKCKLSKKNRQAHSSVRFGCSVWFRGSGSFVCVSLEHVLWVVTVTITDDCMNWMPFFRFISFIRIIFLERFFLQFHKELLSSFCTQPNATHSQPKCVLCNVLHFGKSCEHDRWTWIIRRARYRVNEKTNAVSHFTAFKTVSWFGSWIRIPYTGVRLFVWLFFFFSFVCYRLFHLTP